METKNDTTLADYLEAHAAQHLATAGRAIEAAAKLALAAGYGPMPQGYDLRQVIGKMAARLVRSDAAPAAVTTTAPAPLSGGHARRLAQSHDVSEREAQMCADLKIDVSEYAEQKRKAGK